MALNLNNLTIDDSGRARFSGLSSGIDFVGAVDSIVGAKRIPAVTLENRVSENTAKIAALNELRTVLQSVQNALSTLRGAVSVGGSGDIFESKQAFATVSRVDSQTPSAATNLIGVTASEAAATGSHEIEIRRVATAHKISSKAFTSQTTALSLSGSFTVSNGAINKTITVAAGDSLLDIRDRINTGNTGTSASGVSATVVTASTTEHYLVLTKDTAGADMVVSDTGTLLSNLGISTTNGTGGFRNGLPTGTADGQSKTETADGFRHVLFDGTQADNNFLVSFASGSKGLTLTRGDNTSQTVTLASGAITGTSVETVSFSTFGVTITLDSGFSKTTGIVVDGDSDSITGGTGAINSASIKISDSVGNVSAITSTALTFSNFTNAASVTITTVGGFSGTFAANATGAKTVNLTDGSGNTLQIQFTVGTVFNGSESAASIDLEELENLVVADNTQYDNVLQTAQAARFTADGLKNASQFEADLVANRSVDVSTYTTVTGSSNTFQILNASDSSVVGTVTYNATDSLDQIATAISTVSGVTATVVADGDKFRLELVKDSGSAITLANDTNNLLTSLNFNNDLVIERNTNTITDVFSGLTLSLFQAEAGTTIKVDIENDLAAVNTAIQSFVTAYNAARVFINDHNETDPATSLKGEESGVLFGNPLMNDIRDSLSSIIGLGTAGVDADFSALAQIGVNLVVNDTQTDVLQYDTLTIDQAKLDAKLISNIDDVRKLFAFDFSSSNPDTVFVSHTGNTTYSASGYTINVNYDDRLQGTAITNTTVFAQVDADTGGPAADGISAITFASTVVGNQAFRYSYNGSTEQLTLRNLTTGASEVVSVAAAIDAATGVGQDLIAGETATISFPSLDTTITLSGTNGFTRGSPISDGTLDTTNLAPNLTMTTGAVTTPSSGMNKATVDALIAAGAFTQADGLLTLTVASSGSGEAHINTATGMLFNVDGGGVSADISATDLDDAASHSIGIFVNDGSSNVQVATLSFATLASTAVDAGKTITIDLGTGLLAESATITSATAPMSNYLSVSNGSFEIRDSNSALLGTVNYLAADSLTDVATKVSAISNVTGTIVTSGSTFLLQITHDTNDAITLQSDTGSLVSQHSITDVGNSVLSANIGGAASGVDDGSATVSANAITATDTTNAEGLKVVFTGSTDTSAIKFNFTVGVAARLFYKINNAIDISKGLIQGETAALDGQNITSNKTIEAIDARLVTLRASLTARFIAMEQALSRMNNILNAITQIFALQANKDK